MAIRRVPENGDGFDPDEALEKIRDLCHADDLEAKDDGWSLDDERDMDPHYDG